MQPFFAVIFAIVILGEHLNRWEIVGALGIAGGIVLDRTRRKAPLPSRKLINLVNLLG